MLFFEDIYYYLEHIIATDGDRDIIGTTIYNNHYYSRVSSYRTLEDFLENVI